MSDLTLVEIALDAAVEESDGPLVALQQTVVSRLQQEQATAELANRHYPIGLAILYEARQQIVEELDAAVAQIGLCLFVTTPEARDESPNIADVRLDAAQVIVQAIENPTINRAAGGLGIPGAKLIWLAARDLKRTIVSGSMLLLERMWMEVNPEDQTVVWQASFKLSL